MNVFAGNSVAITQQALWGRALDYASNGSAAGGAGAIGGRPINYGAVVRGGLAKEGVAAFYTPSKWFTRVLMNAPVQGTVPWFYNEVLPLGECAVLDTLRKYVGEPAPPSPRPPW